MIARDVIISEIKTAPEPVVQEVYDFILSLKSRDSVGDQESRSRSDPPDFLARQKILFGEKAINDSGELLNELRSERF
jgi:hypothetical protein